MDDEEYNPCEFCPNSHVVVLENGTCKAECDLPDNIEPGDVPGSFCSQNLCDYDY